MKTFFNKKIYIILLFSAILLPSSAFASSVYIDSNHSEFFVGDTIMITLRIDSLGKKINAIEGEVLLDHETDRVSLTDINVAGSIFSLWPIRPLPSEYNTRISFAGGLPGGFISNNAIVFNIILKLQKTGQIILSPNNIEVYLNDGKGTKDRVNVKDFVINVLPKKSDSQPTDNWNNLISEDKIVPESFKIYLSQDNSVFDGKKFLSFNTIDKQSGVSHYEVIEDNLPPIRNNGTYVLQEQSKPVKVRVTAYDSAGNARESVYIPMSLSIYYPIITVSIIIIIFLTLAIIIFRKILKNIKRLCGK